MYENVRQFMCLVVRDMYKNVRIFMCFKQPFE